MAAGGVVIIGGLLAAVLVDLVEGEVRVTRVASVLAEGGETKTKVGRVLCGVKKGLISTRMLDTLIN